MVAPPQQYDRAAWRARLGIAAGEIVLAFFGLISLTKGLDTLLDALARLPAHFRLLVIGGAATAPADRAYADAIGEQMARLGLLPRVTITGHCAEADVSAHLLAGDIGVLPFADGASLRRGSLLAALAHGLAVVTTRSATDGHPFVDGQNVLLAPPGDATALAAAIERLARDAGLRDQLAAGGRALAAQFGWDAIAAQHEQLYEHLIRR